jgi:hypothetical protein
VPDPRTDRVAFARQVLGIDPFDHEAEALRSEAPYVAIAGGRRSGKSETAQIRALHGLFTHPGGEWLVTSANEDNARQFVAEAADLARGSQIAARAVADELALRLQLDNGASLVAVAPTPGKLRRPPRRPAVAQEANHKRLDDFAEAVATRLAEKLAARPPDALLDAKAAGALLGVPHTWLLKEARADRIPHARLGHYVRFDRDELMAWRKAQTRGPVPLRRAS